MQYLPKADLAKLFRAAHDGGNQLHHLAVLTQFFTGTRISQLLNIRGEDVFERDGKIVVMIRGAKGGNAVIHNLHVDADPAFDMTPMIALAATKGQSRIFGGLSRQYYNVVMKKFAEQAGIHSSFAHSHVMRHSVAMEIFAATQRIGAVTEFLGHKSPASAFCYLRENDNAHAQTAVDNLVLA
jgi:integrase